MSDDVRARAEAVTSATDYDIKKADVRDMIAYLAKWHAAASAYLRDHVVLDDATQTLRYTGDDRIRVTRAPVPPFGLAFVVNEADHVRVLKNVYGNPITVGRVYEVEEWRKLGRRKGVYPQIVGDDRRTITLDHVSHYETVYVGEESARG